MVGIFRPQDPCFGPVQNDHPSPPPHWLIYDAVIRLLDALINVSATRVKRIREKWKLSFQLTDLFLDKTIFSMFAERIIL